MKAFIKNLTNAKSTLTCYVHDKSGELPNAAIRPAMLVFPGGGYMACSDREADPIALAYLAKGYNAFVLRYSVGAKEPASNAFDDACEAIVYLHENAGDLNIDKDKIAVIGFSAGGHLAAWLSVFGKVKPNASILGYPCILPELGKMMGKELPDICGNVSTDTPPAFIFHTRNDKLVPVAHSLAYASALDNAKVGFALHIFADGSHGLSLAEPFTSSGSIDLVSADVAQWFELSVKWLKQVLGDFTVSANSTFNGSLDCDAPLGALMENGQVWKTTLDVFPALIEMIKSADESGQGAAIKGASIRALASFSPDIFTDEKIEVLEKLLKN
jgi:acetyl esterase/lipase